MQTNEVLMVIALSIQNNSKTQTGWSALSNGSEAKGLDTSANKQPFEQYMHI